MLKRRRCEEVVTGNGHKYLFAGTFGNIEAVALNAGDPSQLFADLSEGRMPPSEIKTVIACTLEVVDGTEADELERDELAEQFVEDFGLQDCSLLARQLISHAIIGDVKKKQLERQEATEGLRRRLRLFRLMSFARPGWSWATLLLISSGLVFTTLT